jgi:Ca2+-binding RTX toxin-like protein
MAVFQFSALSDGQVISFNPTADVLNFDQTAIAAADLRVTFDGPGVRVSVVNGTQAGKDVFLQDVVPQHLSINNVTFANGSRLLLGDASSSNANDNAANTLTGTAGRDLFAGFGGNDTMSGGDGDDVFFMWSGFALNYGVDSINGGNGFDVVDFSGVAFSPVSANISATGTLSGGGDGGSGSATVVAIEGVIGGDFNDTLIGGGANNHFRGGAGNDRLDGSSGNDTVHGGSGVDSLRGGPGNDQFIFAEAPGAQNADTVRDFATGLDKLVLDKVAHANLGATGNFAAGDARFFAGAGATSGQDSSDRVIYNTTTGQLFYDADGNGSGASQLIATFLNAPALSATDISVVGQELTGSTIRGTTGNDSLDGTAGNDSIEALAGNDTIDGLAGADTLNGGTGDDFYFHVEGIDTVVDTGGFDQLGTEEQVFTVPAGIEDVTISEPTDGWPGGGTGHLIGNDLDNFLHGATSGGVRLDGMGGNDTFNGSDGGGQDTLDGGAGDDLIFSLFGDDILIGGPGNDTLHGEEGNDTYFVGPGDIATESFSDGNDHDTVFSPVSWTLFADIEDLIFANDGTVSSLTDLTGIGNDSDNLLDARAVTRARLEGRAGNDTLLGGGGNDTLLGGDGNDVVRMSTGTAASYGADVIDGGTGFDIVDFSGVAQSAVTANISAATATMSGGGAGGAGSATVASIEGVIGGDFNDRLIGGGAANRLEGGAGNDTLDASSGNDTLRGGTGTDSLRGGSGIDQFIFAETAGMANADTVRDFLSGTDELLFENGVLTALGAAGAFGAGDGRFRSGAGLTSGQDSSDRLIYNTTTGQLFYDADGSGAGGGQLVATLLGTPALAATDITII